MDQELKRSFTRRLSQSNKGEMIVLIYDIYFAYAKDAERSFEAGDLTGAKEAIRRALETVNTLLDGQDLSYELSGNLRALYRFCRRRLYESMATGNADGLKDSNQILKGLYQSFTEVAKKDLSGPVMQNAQSVYAGVTYGRGYLNETCEQTANRGFLA